jgi:hypothetical protein
MKANNIFTLPLRRVFTLTICAGALTACCVLSAQPVDANGGPRKPPAEALDACKSSSSGQECSFTSQQGTAKGTCWAPEGKPLACKPKEGPPGNSNSPKQ